MVKYLDNNSGFQQFAAARNNNNSGKKSGGWLWWIILGLLAFWTFSLWQTPKNKTEIVAQKTEISGDISNVPKWIMNSDKIGANIQGLRISKITLTNYSEKLGDDKNAPITLLSDDKDFSEIGLIANGTVAPSGGTVWNKIKSTDSNNIVMNWKNNDGVDFTRIITINNYIVNIKDVVKNNSGRDVSFAPYARIVRSAGAKTTTNVATGGIAMVDGGIERANWKDIEKKSYAFTTSAGFVGFEEQYWQTIAALSATDQTIRIKRNESGLSQSDVAAAAVAVQSGKTVSFETNLFAGPKDQSVLVDAGQAISGIDQTIDYGWFWFLARPFLLALNYLFAMFGNYGVAIIILTIILRGFMWPLTRKSYSSMAAMQKMQPEMQRIQKLYANDKIRLQQEMMNLYKSQKTSPMSGCLPMLVQIPIFFALYKALLISVPMRQAGFLWMSDLSVLDPYFILPILMGGTMWWQQKLQKPSVANNNSNDPMAATQKLMKWLPVIFTVMFAWMPAGLVLYWAVSNLCGIGQMYVIKRKN